MSQRFESPDDCIAWAKKVNSRWIVHRDLAAKAAAFIDQLAARDPERLARSCRNAQKLVQTCGAAEDPKPWFYGGLFSLATAEEVDQFLAGHAFTASIVPSAQENPALRNFPLTLSPSTRDQLRKLQAAVTRVIQEER